MEGEPEPERTCDGEQHPGGALKRGLAPNRRVESPVVARRWPFLVMDFNDMANRAVQHDVHTGER